jgi:hypothetical protein
MSATPPNKSDKMSLYILYAIVTIVAVPIILFIWLGITCYFARQCP